MKSAEKKKNILDLNHQKNLNYMNIIIILVISSFITLVVGGKIDKDLLFPSIILVVSIVVITITFFEDELRKIRNKIKELR